MTSLSASAPLLTGMRAPVAIDLAHEADARLGPVLVRPSHREVVMQGRSIRLEPRVMQVLVALMRADGQVVSRAELIERCWSGRIVSQDAVYRCIQHLRGLAVRERAFRIETIGRVGYRLHAATARKPSALARWLRNLRAGVWS